MKDIENKKMAGTVDKARRRTLKIMAGTAVAGIAGPSGLFSPGIVHAQQKFRFKLGISLPAAHPNPKNLKLAAEKILAATDGRLSIEVFPAGQLGSDTDMLSQVRSGALEMFSTAGGVWGTLIPACSINGVAFAWPDEKTLWAAYDGDLGAYLRKQFEPLGLVAQNKIWDHGFRFMTTGAKPITKPDDLVGMKFRVPNSPLAVSLFEMLGASPTNINFGELYTALQTGLVDGQENPAVLIETGKLYEVQKYCAQTSHMWDGFWIVSNKRRWDSLPDDLRSTASRIFDEQAVLERKEHAELAVSTVETLKGHGMVFNQVDPMPFREKLKSAGFYANWQKKFGEEAWGLLEKYAGKLG
ncbi:ABC transporter substrate-binding protein [Rhizobium wenxiniae]|uniref:Tripartite ATP-independent transporter DctP family solute receptor n=1 Tax=Rhizobium wenxiniae TaxID=1737357 RepID=A0A7X0D2B6_9HYPH|nr:TRAP transporter substrate-binding protein [Rhizobium wenxiniae]MBB6165312.1 tripartite ATP-independent transporter DctP family solute receptor [Rhizobium wenxiniae]GGG14423.1 ABC transporter substrate-binding protein [Rhizobium wenxiniae]